MTDHDEETPVDPDEYARLLAALERFAQEVPHLAPGELVRRTQAFESDLEAFVPMHTAVVALLRRVADRATAGLDTLPDVPEDVAGAVDPSVRPDAATPAPSNRDTDRDVES